jgi:calreticulin
LTHTYTLIVKPDQTYQILIDGDVRSEGSLLEDWEFLPPKQIQDPEASKPADWVEDALIDDEADVKPAGYDDIPEFIPDPEAKKPEDWDDDMDGEWEVPSIPNPEYLGPWTPKKIANPLYKGEWEHPLIDNPEYKVDNDIYAYDFGNVGIDVWQVKSGTIFDNILITDDIAEAEKIREQSKALREKEGEVRSAYTEKLEAEAKAKAGADVDIAAEGDASDSTDEELKVADEPVKAEEEAKIEGINVEETKIEDIKVEEVKESKKPVKDEL